MGGQGGAIVLDRTMLDRAATMTVPDRLLVNFSCRTFTSKFT